MVCTPCGGSSSKPNAQEGRTTKAQHGRPLRLGIQTKHFLHQMHFPHKMQVLGFHANDMVPVRAQLSLFSGPETVTMVPWFAQSAGSEGTQARRTGRLPGRDWWEAHNGF